MARGDLDEARFMAGRSLALLLTGAAPRDGGEMTIPVAPETLSPGEAGPTPTLRPILHLLAAWLALRGLFSEVLPMLSGSGPRRETASDPGARGVRRDRGIDWQATFARMAAGETAPVPRLRWSVPDERARHYAALLFSEIAEHAGELASRFAGWSERAAAPIAGMLGDLGYWRGRLLALLDDPAWCPFKPGEPAQDRLREAYRESLDSEGDPDLGLHRRYRTAAHEVIGARPASSAVDLLVRRLESWREQYLGGEVWLADRAGFDLAVGRLDGLFELWCFAELLVVAQALGVEGIAQRSLLRRGASAAGEPAFEVGLGRYAYYDFGAHHFRELDESPLASVPAGTRPALPGARVEWFILDPADFRRSLVLDAKYYRSWDSGAALKVMGYMQNFGVLQAAVVFAGELDGLERVVEPVVPGLYRLRCPTPDPGTLWVLRLEPSAAAGPSNARALEALVRGALLGEEVEG